MRKMPTERGKTPSVASFARLAFAALSFAFACLASATPPLAVQRYGLEEGMSQLGITPVGAHEILLNICAEQSTLTMSQ